MPEPRRSKRSATTKPIPTDNSGDEDPNFDVSEAAVSEAAQSSTVAPPKKKRKTTKTRRPKAPPKTAKLRYIVEMPLEILAEIFSYTHPRDLMHLSRANKALRAILLHRSALPVWQASLANLWPGFPECPEDMTIPQLVNFLYGYTCFYCSKKKSTSCQLIVCWEMRINACKKCCYQNFEHSVSRRDLWLPTVELKLPGPAGGRSYAYKWSSIELRAEYDKLTESAREAWLKAKANFIEASWKLKHGFQDWERSLQEEHHRLEVEAHERTKERIRALLRDMGWASELIKLEQDEPSILWSAVDLDAVSKEPMPENVRIDLQDTLGLILQRYQQNRIDQGSNWRIDKALQVIASILETYSHAHFLVPSSGDVYQMGPIQAAIFEVFASSGDEDVDFAREEERMNTAVTQACTLHLHEATQAWIAERKKEFSALVPRSNIDPQTPLDLKAIEAQLNLARNRFRFSHYPKDSLTWIQMLQNPRTHQMDQDVVKFLNLLPKHHIRLSSTTCKEERDHALLKQCVSDRQRRHTPWNCCPQESTNTIHFDAEIVPIVEAVARLCKLDAANATHIELAAYPMVFRCGNLQCYYDDGRRPVKTRKYYSPDEAIQHYASSHRANLGKNSLHSEATDYLVPVEDEALFSYSITSRSKPRDPYWY